MRVLLLALLLSTVALAGCSDEPAAEEPAADEPSDLEQPEANEELESEAPSNDPASNPEPEPSAPADPENAAPTGGIQAAGTTGTIPLRVEFSLTGADTDGDDLSWTLDADADGVVDDEGVDLPWTSNFTYETAGIFNATFTLTDGTDVVVYNITIEASEATVEEAPPITYAGAWTANPTGCALVGGSTYDGVTQGVALVGPETWGHDYVVTLTTDGGGLGGDLIIMNSGGDTLETVAADLDTPTPAVMPADAVRIVVRICGVGPAGYEIVVAQ